MSARRQTWFGFRRWRHEGAVWRQYGAVRWHVQHPVPRERQHVVGAVEPVYEGHAAAISHHAQSSQQRLAIAQVEELTQPLRTPQQHRRHR
eukprot:scaffold4470_cov255-Prasinococcus_capsulatus_cf.AAC.28